MSPLFRPDNFANDPYGNTTNQLAHQWAIGILLFAWAAPLLYWHVYGEYPIKWQFLIWFGIAYFVYELVDQGWHGWDTINDWFNSMTPTAGAFWVFREVTAGSRVICGDPQDAWPFVLVLGVGLIYQAIRRTLKKVEALNVTNTQ